MDSSDNSKNFRYFCNICNFYSNQKIDWDRHILRPKHINKCVNDKEKLEKNFICNICNKIFKYQSGLCKHKKKCIKIPDEVEIKEVEKNEENKLIITTKDEQINELKNMMKDLIKHNGELMKQNSELVQTIKDITPKMGNNTINNNCNNTTNNTFNLQLFLNEKCKDAINMSEFIETIEFTDDDLENSRLHGGISTLSNVMIKCLKQLDVTKRPLHCTDVKRETLYIKEEDKWEKDENHEKIMDALGDIAQKQREYLWEWSDANPDSQDVMHPLNDIFHLTNIKVLDPLTKKEEEDKKFIRNVAREVTIDKTM